MVECYRGFYTKMRIYKDSVLETIDLDIITGFIIVYFHTVTSIKSNLK